MILTDVAKWGRRSLVLGGLMAAVALTNCGDGNSHPDAGVSVVARDSGRVSGSSVASPVVNALLGRARLLLPDSRAATVGLLDSTLRNVPGADSVAAVYLLLGQASNAAVAAGSFLLLSELAERFPDRFEYVGESDWIFYDGYHLRELMRRFPDDSLVDDAAYELTRH